ncbi:MAG TPA: class I SAM-dependent methyltransferase [Candidatus Limnocylindria bacterium]|nr:class I SAM-dependent methyltransferase [Candidatus Limnocylindria bacterium]
MRDAEIDEMARLEDTHWWFVGKRILVASALGSVAGGRALDVGCGTGRLVTELGRRWRCYGTDVSRTALAHSLRRGCDGLVNAAAERLPFRAGSFVLVTALDVIEHADDDRAVLAEICRVLVRDGTLVVSVPAVPALWSAHDVALGHRRRYTRRTLRAALESAGFIVVSMSYTNTAIFPIAAAVRLLSRLRPPAPGSESDMFPVPAPLNRFLIALYRIEAMLIRHVSLPIGVSLLAVAKRSDAPRTAGPGSD